MSGLDRLREPAVCASSSLEAREIWVRLIGKIVGPSPLVTKDEAADIFGAPAHYFDDLDGKRLILRLAGERPPIEFSVKRAEHRCDNAGRALPYGDLCSAGRSVTELTVYHVPAPGETDCPDAQSLASQLNAAGWSEPASPAPDTPPRDTFVFDINIRGHAVFSRSGRKIYFMPADHDRPACLTSLTYYASSFAALSRSD